jgi:hypothetical protein
MGNNGKKPTAKSRLLKVATALKWLLYIAYTIYKVFDFVKHSG